MSDNDDCSMMKAFKESLKENLGVKVLPRMPPKLIKAHEFDHITEENLAAKEGD